jgi:hypothetical protein
MGGGFRLGFLELLMAVVGELSQLGIFEVVEHHCVIVCYLLADDTSYQKPGFSASGRTHDQQSPIGINIYPSFTLPAIMAIKSRKMQEAGSFDPTPLLGKGFANGIKYVRRVLPGNDAGEQAPTLLDRFFSAMGFF